MGKHKTLEKKKQLGLKRQVSPSPTSHLSGTTSAYSYAYTLPQISLPHQTSNKVINQYEYVTHDLIKTVLLSTSIIAFQVILYLLLKLHVLSIPFIKY